MYMLNSRDIIQFSTHNTESRKTFSKKFEKSVDKNF